MPLLVLSADRPWGPQVPSMIAAGILPADIPPDFGYVTDNAQKQAQQLRFETCQDHLTHFLTREHLTFEQRFGKRQETDKLREADKEKMKTYDERRRSEIAAFLTNQKAKASKAH